MLLFCTSFNTLSQEMAIYLKNTGDENIYVAYGYGHYIGFSSDWETIYRGWLPIQPGERKYITSIYSELSSVSIAFAKRDGYIKYNYQGNTNHKFGEDTIYVDPADVFKYTDKAPSSYIPIATSLKIKLRINRFGNHILYQTFEVPSYLTDKVLPMKVLDDVITNTSKSKKTASDSLTKTEASSLAPLGTYKTKKGDSLENDTDGLSYIYPVNAYIKKTALYVKAGDLLCICSIKTYPMSFKYVNEPLDNLNEYESGNRVSDSLNGALYVRIGNGRWKLVGKGGELKATSDGELQFMVNETKRDMNSLFFQVSVKYFKN